MGDTTYIALNHKLYSFVAHRSCSVVMLLFVRSTFVVTSSRLGLRDERRVAVAQAGSGG